MSNFTIDVLDKDGIIVDSTTYTTYPDPSVTRDAGGVEGRFVKVQINGIGSLNLAEVQVAEAVEKKYLASLKVLDSSNNDSISYATLTIDDLVYTSNFTGEIELCLEEGEYPFTLNKDGYNLLNGTLDINSDTNEIFLITPSGLASIESSIADNIDTIADNIDIYPIPVSDILNIKLPSSETAKMSIINSIGQLMISCNIEKGSASVDIRELSAGFYIINISNGNKIYSRNIIVK